MILFSILCLTTIVGAVEQPEQVHLSLGAQPTEMMVTWVTMNTSPAPVVEYGINGFTEQTKAETHLFIDSGSEHRHIYIHRAFITGLEPNQKYEYRCGDSGVWSQTFSFKTIPEGTDWNVRLAVYGDMGAENAQSVPRLVQDVKNGIYDAILHVGDLAYDLDADNSRVGDQFMRIIEPIAAYVPYQVCPGNHEQIHNFSNYVNRFSMVDTRSRQINNHFYSFNMGTAHIISFSTEFYYFTNYGWDQISTQYEWLEADLKEANKPENRALRPWIIFMAHKSLYCMIGDNLCSSVDGHVFQRHDIRKGIKMKGEGDYMYGLEDLLHNHKVDLQLYGHEHVYHRSFPLYDNHVFNGTKTNPYHNPTESIAIVTGSAGCKQKVGNFSEFVPKWSAFRSTDYGYSRLTIHNRTHISWEQISDDQNGKIIDQFTLIKDRRELHS